MQHKINIKYIIILLIAVFVSTILHEWAHGITGELLGNKMMATLNNTQSISRELVHEWNRNYITMAGPIFTILQAIFCYYLLKKYPNIYLYPFLFFPLFMRFAAGIANFFGPNDEGRLGLSYGIGLYTISILVCTFLYILVFKTSKRMQINWKFNLMNFLLCLVFLVFLSYIDFKFKIRIM